MTDPADSATLWLTDRPAWLRAAAAKVAPRIGSWDRDQIRHAWSCMGQDYRDAVKALLSRADRETIEAALRAPAPEGKLL